MIHQGLRPSVDAPEIHITAVWHSPCTDTGWTLTLSQAMAVEEGNVRGKQDPAALRKSTSEFQVKDGFDL